MGRTIGVFSGKGGVGKTVTAVNLGVALRELGEDVLCVDGDVNAPNIALQLGMDPESGVAGETALEDAIYVHRSGLTFMPSAHVLDRNDLDAERLRATLDRTHSTSIVDAPPGFHDDVHALMDAVDEAVVVSTPEVPALRDAEKTVGMLAERGTEVNGVVLNMVDAHAVPVEEIGGAPVIARVPVNADVKASVRSGEPVATYSPYSDAGVAYRRLAAALAGEPYEEPSYRGIRRLIHRLRGRS